MRKNNKGFTLVELLAVFVILAIISVFGIPAITRTITNSRNRMYVTDAQKMIAAADYKIRAANSKIEKPDPGDCIAISLVYLESSDFDHSPNEGEYEKEASFVVVKNNNGKLEYASTIIEKLKDGGYKGIALSSDKSLKSTSVSQLVRTFKERDLIYVEDGLSPEYINKRLGNSYISASGKISAIYNYPDLDDSSSQILSDSKPHIIKASLQSASGKNYNSLDAILNLRVDDGDTPRRKLKVYISTSEYSENNSIDYGEQTTFSYNVNFADYGYHYDGTTANLFIIVKDPEGNTDMTNLTYKIHNNYSPVINKEESSLSKRPLDSKNMITSLLHISTYDDVDDLNSLSVCLYESNDDPKDMLSNGSTDLSQVCSNYRNYFDIFDNTHTHEYTFHNCGSGGCKRDGTTHYLTVFVKDSFGAFSYETFNYKFSTNTNPVFTSAPVIIPNEESFGSTGSKDVVVSFKGEDDYLAEQMIVQITDDPNDPSRMQQFEFGTERIEKNFQYDFSRGNSKAYDGSLKTLRVTLIDYEGLSTSVDLPYKLYANKPPTIEEFSIESNGNACPNVDLCPLEDGGSENALLSVNIKDDIDVEDNYKDVEICVSENQSYCDPSVSANKSHYTSFSDYYLTTNSLKITSSGNVYDGSTHSYYLYAKDTYDQVAVGKVDYKVYKNKPPLVYSFYLDSQAENFTIDKSLDTVFQLDAIDDFDDDNDVQFSLTEGPNSIQDKTLADYQMVEVPYRMSGTYDGGVRNFKISLIDQMGEETLIERNYEVYKNLPPVIEQFEISSEGSVCDDDNLCPPELGGTRTINYLVEVSDDIDFDDNYSSIKLCLSEDSSYCDPTNPSNDSHYKPYSEYYDFEAGASKIFSLTFPASNPAKPYDGEKKKFYLYVKDSSEEGDGISIVEREYQIYKNQPPKIFIEPSIVPHENIANVNLMDLTYSVSAADDLGPITIKYCYDINSTGEHFCTDAMTYIESRRLNKGEELEVVVDTPGEDDGGEIDPGDVVDDPDEEIIPAETHGVHFFDNITEYDAQDLNIYCILTDEYGETSGQDMGISYKLFKDASPAIDSNSLAAAYDLTYYKDSLGNIYFDQPDGDGYTLWQRVNITFSVKDLLDKYQVCVSDVDDANACTQYSAANSLYHESYWLKEECLSSEEASTGDGCDNISVVADYYDGTDLGSHSYYFSFPGNIGDKEHLYVFLKDQKGNPPVRYVVDPKKYEECELRDESSGVYTYEFGQNYTYRKLPNQNEEGTFECTDEMIANGECSGDDIGNPEEDDGEIYDEDDISELNCTSTTDSNGVETFQCNNTKYDTPINPTTCQAKCYRTKPLYTLGEDGDYHKQAGYEENKIVSYYKKIVTYKDFFNGNTCDSTRDEFVVKKDCSYKDCFKHGDSYETKAIGSEVVKDATSWTYTDGETTYVNNHHYNLYLTDYQAGEEGISTTLVESEKICIPFFENGGFAYDDTQEKPYVQIRDP